MPEQPEMDSHEQLAADCEKAQTERLGKHKGSHDSFWTEKESSIFRIIKNMRSLSDTYHPDNER